MAKITIPEITDAPGSVIPAINSNFQQIAAEFNDKALYRDNPATEPNQMDNDLDMNAYDILNTANVYAEKLFLQGIQILPDGTAAQSIVEVDNASYSVKVTDDVILCTGTCTLTLPSISGAGKTLSIDAEGGTVTINPVGGDTITGSVDYLLASGQAIQLVPKASTLDWRAI